MDNAVYTFEQLLHQNLESMEEEHLCKGIQRCQDMVIKKFDYDSSTVRKRFFREALLQILIPYLLKQLSPSCAGDLPRYQELIFEDFSRFLLVENMFEEVVLQSVMKDITMVVREAAVQRRHNLFRDSIVLRGSDLNLQELAEKPTVDWAGQYGGEEAGSGFSTRRRQVVSMIQLEGTPTLLHESCLDIPGVEKVPEERGEQSPSPTADTPTSPHSVNKIQNVDSPTSPRGVNEIQNVDTPTSPRGVNEIQNVDTPTSPRGVNEIQNVDTPTSLQGVNEIQNVDTPTSAHGENDIQNGDSASSSDSVNVFQYADLPASPRDLNEIRNADSCPSPDSVHAIRNLISPKVEVIVPASEVDSNPLTNGVLSREELMDGAASSGEARSPCLPDDCGFQSLSNEVTDEAEAQPITEALKDAGRSVADPERVVVTLEQGDAEPQDSETGETNSGQVSDSEPDIVFTI